MVAQRMPQPQYMTVDEWCELERQSEIKRTLKNWEYQAYGSRDEIELTSINVCFPVAALYKQTDMPEALDIPKSEV